MEFASRAPASHADVSAKLDANAFDAALIPTLEAYVKEQAKTTTYDARANKALLKLYQFFPEKTDTAVLALLLGKAIMALPSPDFANARFLVPAAVQDSEPFAALIALALKLETAKFDEYWAARAAADNAAAATLAQLAGVDDAVRRFIVDTLALTFQALPLDFVAKALGLPAADAKKFLGAVPGLTVGAEVVFAQNSENQPRPKAVSEHESVRIESMIGLIGALGTAHAT